MLLISSFLLHSGGSALVHPCSAATNQKKQKLKCRSITIKPQFGEYLLTFPTTEPANPRERKNYKLNLIVKQRSNNCCYLSISLENPSSWDASIWKTFRRGGARKTLAVHPGRLTFWTQKWRFGSGDWTFQFGDLTRFQPLMFRGVSG